VIHDARRTVNEDIGQISEWFFAPIRCKNLPKEVSQAVGLFISLVIQCEIVEPVGWGFAARENVQSSFDKACYVLHGALVIGCIAGGCSEQHAESVIAVSN
jgi:hypothetical protein